MRGHSDGSAFHTGPRTRVERNSARLRQLRAGFPGMCAPAGPRISFHFLATRGDLERNSPLALGRSPLGELTPVAPVCFANMKNLNHNETGVHCVRTILYRSVRCKELVAGITRSARLAPTPSAATFSRTNTSAAGARHNFFFPRTAKRTRLVHCESWVQRSRQHRSGVRGNLASVHEGRAPCPTGHFAPVLAPGAPATAFARCKHRGEIHDKRSLA